MNVLISGAGIAGPTLASGSGNTDLRRRGGNRACFANPRLCGARDYSKFRSHDAPVASSQALTGWPGQATTSTWSSVHASGCAKEPREDFAGTLSRPLRSMAQTTSQPPSSPLASCRQRMPASRICDAGSPKELIFATMRALQKKCSRSSTRPEPNP